MITFGLMGSIRKKLAPVLALALTAVSVGPVTAGAAPGSASSDSSASITSSVYNSVYGTAPAPVPRTAAAPLSWSVLSKLSHGFMSMVYASADRPVSKLSTDERYWAFLTYDMEDDAATGRKIVIIQDRRTGALTRVKTPDATGWVHHFDMTPDARYVAYSYSDSAISPNVKVYLYDRTTDSLETVNATGSTDGYADFEGDTVSVSADGRYVAFDTLANGLVPGDADGKRDVYLYDRQASGSKLKRISSPLAANWNDESRDPSISADGSRVAFVSKSKLTELDDYIGTESLYLYTPGAAAGQELKRVTQGYTPVLSRDGRFMAFSTYRDDLTSGDSNGKDDIYVYDDADAGFRRVSLNPDGTEHDRDSKHPAISPNGAYVAYETEVLVQDGTNVDEETEVYAADSQGLASWKMAVPGAPVSLRPSAKLPSVADAGTVSFYSMYMEKINGTDFPMPDYFIAGSGTMPVWPSGSTLQASDAGTDRITLSWPAASDPDGITGYALYRNGEPILYTPSTGASSYTVNLTGQPREAGMSYLYQVEAVDSRYHWSMNGPSYNWEAGSTPPPGDADLFLIWTGERSEANGPLKQEGTIKLTARGTTGLETRAEWVYKGEDAGGTAITKTESTVLTETAAGSGWYGGTFRLPAEAAELISIKLVQKQADGSEKTELAENLPVPVGGGLQISFTNATLEELRGAILTVWGSSSERTLVVGNNGVGPITGLMPGDAYQLILHTPDYQYDMGSLDGIAVRAGKTTAVTIPVTVPAQVRVKVVNAEGRPVVNVPVSLWDAEHQLLMKTTTGADGLTYSHEGLLRDQVVTAELDLSDLYYDVAPGTSLSLKLAGGDNVLTVPLISPDRGTLELTVKDPGGAPVFNAYVSATQMYKGRPVVTQARTSLDGKVRMELFAGDAVLEANEFSYLYSSGQVQARVAANSTTALDLPVRQPGQGVVNLHVFKKALDTNWQGPLNMSNEAFLSHVESNHGWISTYFSNAVTIGGGPGTPVNVCVSGSIYAYVNQCKTVTLDGSSNATAEIRLEEKGARIQGTVATGRDKSYSAAIYELKDNGSKVYVASAWDSSFQTEPFNINVPKGGHYLMEVTQTSRDAGYRYTYKYGSVDFTVNENEIKNLGSLSFSANKFFANQPGNRFSAQPSRAMPGGSLTLRASYRNNSGKTARDAELLLDIPEGMTLVADAQGNQAVAGAKGPVTLQGNTLHVPVGTLDPDAEGTVICKLAVSSGFDKSSAATAARIKTTLDAEAVEEIIGTVYLDTPKVTLEAPDRVTDANRLAVLSGFAPAGSTLTLYDSGVKIGSAAANASGAWKASVALAELGTSGYHALWAETEAGGVSLKSAKSFTLYDTAAPRLLRMAMSQAPSGKWVTVENGKDAADFAYTVVPGNPFLVDFEFSDPDQVENVRVYIEGQEGDPIAATREGSLYKAIVPTTTNGLGGIYVDYDVKKTERVYDGAIPSLEDVRASLPPRMRDFEVVSTTPFEQVNGVYQGTVVLKFPQLANKRMSITLKLNPNSDYHPTEAEKALAADSGVPAIQSGFDVNQTGKTLSITTRGYMPANLLAEDFQGFALARSLGRPAKAGDWGHTVEYFMEIKSDVDEVKDQIDEYKGEFEEQLDTYMGFAGKVNKIMYNVETSGMDCLEELPTTVKQGGKALASLVVGEVAKVALGAWTGAMALTGAPAVIAGYATDVLEDKIDNYVDEQIDAIGTGYNQCSDNPDRQKKRGFFKVARPKWIYDPSGYVYEAVKSNPLAEVTATVLYQDPGTGVWKVWDASEYDQVNPQQTDAKGKYGWDVPPGKWKVVWSKDGYEPVSSTDLDVPPPQTDVNAGLISRASPQITTVTGVTYDGGSYVDVIFSKYLKVIGLQDGAVTVTDAGGTVVEGKAAFIGQEAGGADPKVMLSRTIRVTTKDLKAGSAYKVKVDPAYITSYAGVKITDSDASAVGFTAKMLDKASPAVESVKVEGSGRILRVTFNEPIASAADSAAFKLNGIDGSITSAVLVTEQGQPEARSLLLTINGAVSSSSTLTLPAGAVKDLEGNASEAVQRTVTAVSNPGLSVLTVEQGAISPAFNEAVTEYGLKLPAGTKKLTLTAAAADSSAKLLVNGLPAANGLAQSVDIPDDGQVHITVEQNGMAVRTYRMKITWDAAGPSSVNDLSGLTLSGGTLSPAFSKDTLAYTVELPAGTAEVSVTATAADAKAKLTVNGAAAQSGTASTVRLPADGKLQVVVESEAGTQKTYTIQVTVKSNTGGGSGSGGGSDSGSDSGDSSDSGTGSGTGSGSGGTGGGAAPSPGTPVPPATASVDLTGKTAIVKKPNSAGGTALYLAVGEDAVSQALKDGAQSKTLTIQVQEQADQYILQLSGEDLALIARQQAVLRLVTPLLNAGLDPSALSGIQPEKAPRVRLTLDLTRGQLTGAAQESAGRLFADGVALVASAALTAGTEDGTKLEAVQLKGAGKPALTVEWTGLQGKANEVYRFAPGASSWTYVPSKASGSGQGLQFGAGESGLYAAVRYTNPFEDLNGHWAKEEIDRMARRLLVNGVTPKEFQPDGAVTRAEFAAMLVRALGIQTGGPSGGAGAADFADVPQDAWYYSEVQAAVSQGLVNGKAPGRFAPNEPITREEMAVMIGRAYQLLNAGGGSSGGGFRADFADSGSIHDWAKDAVALMVKEGLMQGMTASTFEPGGRTTRAQAAVVLERFLKKRE